jgi:hypothetical protein
MAEKDQPLSGICIWQLDHAMGGLDLHGRELISNQWEAASISHMVAHMVKTAMLKSPRWAGSI